MLALAVLIIYGTTSSCRNHTITGYVLVDYDSDGDVNSCVVVPKPVTDSRGSRTDACNGSFYKPGYYYESDGSRRSTEGLHVYAITRGTDGAAVLRSIHMPPERCQQIAEKHHEENRNNGAGRNQENQNPVN